MCFGLGGLDRFGLICIDFAKIHIFLPLMYVCIDALFYGYLSFYDEFIVPLLGKLMGVFDVFEVIVEYMCARVHSSGIPNLSLLCQWVYTLGAWRM